MSFSYSALHNYGRTTLPSVESWSTNNNIMRDPPKSITTRKIEKVGDTTFLNDIIDESTDRNSEAINVYARGVNPMVSVSYSNNGNNGGQLSGNMVVGGGNQGKLPYRIMNGGAFRPPIVKPQDLLPVSRSSRKNTNITSKAHKIDYSRRIKLCGDDTNTREVKKDMIRGNVKPNKTYKYETPQDKPSDVKYKIKNVLEGEIVTNKKSVDVIKRINKNISNTTQNKLQMEYGTNKSQNIHKDVNDGITDLRNIKTQSVLHGMYETNKTTQLNHNIRHENKITLSKNVPEHRMEIGVKMERKYNNVSGNSYRLNEKVTVGKFDAKPCKPGNIRISGIPTLKAKA